MAGCRILTFLLLIISIFKGANASGFENSQVGINPLAPTDTIVISTLIITGNKITKMPIITRELMIHEGDTLQLKVFEKAVERTRENLMNTSLFNFVTITHQMVSPTDAVVIIDLKERWYIIPLPIFELVDRNFNEWVKSGDWTRVNYGMYLDWNNFRGRNETLKLQFRWGYSQRIGISYSIPYINKNQREGLSFGYAYGRNREVGYKVKESKQLLYQHEDFVRKEIYGGVRYTQRMGYYNTSSFSVEYRYNTISDSVAILNPDFFGKSRTTQELITISWLLRRDHRDYKVYALKGYYFEFEAVKNGLGLMKNEPDLIYFTSTYRYFRELANRWYFATGVKGKLSGQSVAPYYNQRGFGFGNEFVRGYEYYVVPGQNFLLNRNSLKFALVPTHVITLPFSMLEKFRTIPYAFYLNANVDVGYVRDRQFENDNPVANSFQFGYGLGIDYVTYYNLVFRLEYTFNKFGENGFFLHFTAPI